MNGEVLAPSLVDWLHPRTQVSWATQASIGVSVLLLVLFAGLYLWRRQLPGPLTSVERRAAIVGGPWKLLTRFLAFGFAAMAVLGALALVWDVGRPTVLVLHSRARRAGHVDRLVPSGAVRVLDLGPVVDELLTDCLADDAERTFGASCRESLPVAGPARERLARAIGAALPRLQPSSLAPRQGAAYKLPASRQVSIDVATIESIELAVVDYWIARTHPFRIRVAAQASVGLSSWAVARHVLSIRGWTLDIIDARDVTAPGLHIRTMAGGRITPDGSVSLWAVVDGREPRTTPLRFPVIAGAGGAGVQLGWATAEVLNDELDSRILLARGHISAPGTCSGSLPVVARRPLELEPGPDLPLECVDPNAIPTLHTTDAANWQARLDRVRRDASTEALSAFRDDLESLGAALPQVSTGSAAPVLVTRGGDVVRGPTLLVVATTPSLANRIAAEASKDPSVGQLPRTLRVMSSAEGPSTRFSWQALPVVRGRVRSVGASLVSAQAREDAWSSSGRPEGSNVAVAWSGAEPGPRGGRYVVIRVPEGAWTELQERETAREPDARFALARSLSRAAAWVLSGGIDVLDIGTEDALATETVGPLLAGTDIEALALASEPFRDAGSVLLVGVYLLFSLGVAVFALRGADMPVRGAQR